MERIAHRFEEGVADSLRRLKRTAEELARKA
jgi:hypothetical protein